jgi:hypothetical protein
MNKRFQTVRLFFDFIPYLGGNYFQEELFYFQLWNNLIPL